MDIYKKENQSPPTRRPYPKPRVPLLPLLAWGAFSGYSRLLLPCIEDVGEGIDVGSGTAAIALALRHAGIKQNDKVLVPAFHCRSMIEPVLAHSAVPVYYRIHDDTSVDLEDIRSKVNDSTRALVVAHYFGFPQDMPSLRMFCDNNDIILIEDCAHAFFGHCGGRPVGWYGDYAVASVRKFFPTYDGGYLTSSRHSINDIALKSGGFVFHAKAALDIVEEAGNYGRLKSLNSILALPNFIKEYVRGRIKSIHRNAAPISIGPDISEGYRYLDLAQVNRRMSIPSRLIVHTAARSRIVRRRRANYNKLANGLSGLANARPLMPELPDAVVPYMFPFLIDDPEKDFPRLKQQGVPIFRWEDMETAECATSLSYSLRLLQLPCHQELRDAELDWMIKCITDTLGNKHR